MQNVGQETNPITFNGALIADNAGYPFFLRNVHYITIQDAIFDDVTTQANTGYRIQRAVYFEGTNNNITLNHLIINQTALSSIEKQVLSNLYGVTISNTTITNPSGYGIFLTDGISGGMEFYLTGVVINNTTVTGATIDGIRVTMGRPSISENVTITGTTVSNSTQHGFYLLTRGVFDFERNTLTGNGFNGGTGADGQFYGLYLLGDGNTSSTITNDNSFTRNRNGVFLQNVGEEANPLAFDGSLLVDNAGYIFFFNGGRYVNITGGVWDDTTTQASTGYRIQRAITIDGTSTNITLNGATINGTNAQAIYISGTTTNLTVTNTSISGSGASGIEKVVLSNLYGATISNTTITNPNGYGILLTDGITGGIYFYLTDVVINNTTVTGATIDGIRVTMARSLSQNVTITNTTVSNSTQHGIYLQAKGTINLENNISSNNSGWGVYITGYDNPAVTFNNNHIENNANGLHLQSISGGTFQDNQLINNAGDDLYATGDTSNTFTRLTVGLAHPTVVTFDYVNGIVVNGVESPPADISGLLNIGKYVDMQGLGSTSVNLKVYYSPAAAVGLNEASLKIFHYNAGWSVLSPPNGVNTTERYVYADGITSFSVFAAMGGPADTVYVDGVGGSEANDGFTPLTAKLTINAGIEAASNNWTVNVYPNTTYIEDLLVNKDITLQPYGVGSVALNGSITINSDGSGSTIQGFTVTGSGGSNGITLNSADNCQIIGNTISNSFIGIYMQNSNSNTVSGNSVQNNGWVGVCIDNSSNNTINGGNVITGNVEGVLIANTSTGNTISGNNIHINSDTGITILDNPTSNTISDNTAISGNGVIGILIRNADTNTVSGNTIQNNGWAGVALDNADGNFINGSNNISGNQEGLNLTNSDGNTVTANNIFDNVNIGLSVINGSTDNFITGNSAISDNGIIGLYFRDSGVNMVSGNVVQINGWVGMCLDNASGNTINGSNDVAGNMEGLYIVNNSNNNTITANNIHENADTGVYIDGSTGDNITGNTAISGNGVIGVLFRNADGNTISGNTLSGNSFAGIALDSADSNIINGANIISGSSMGLYVTNNSSSNTINNNTLQNNTWAGLVLDFAINTTVYQNNFVNNPLQALAQNGAGNSFYQGTTGNYWSDCTTTDPRSIAGNEGLYDQYPSLTPF